MFAERGYHGASLDEVAAVAGFTKGAVYSNFKSKEDLFLALFRANLEQEMADLRATLVRTDGGAQGGLSPFVRLVQGGSGETGTNFGLLLQEFWLYAARNPAAREQLTRIEDQAVGDLAQLLESEREKEGLAPLATPLTAARLVQVLFRGIGMLRTLQPDVVDDAFVQDAITFVARGLGAPDP